MGIDIASLGLSRATIGRSVPQKQTYKITSEQAKAALTKATEDGDVRDLLDASGGRTVDMDAMVKAAGGRVQRLCNYSTSVFFQKEMPEQLDEDGGYTVSGVRFSEAELQQARGVLLAAADSITAGPGRNTNLDYRNYAQMAVAENAVGVYADGHLSEEQSAVVKNAMRDYNEGLMEMQDRLLGQRQPTDGTEYYGSKRVMTQVDADLLNSLKAEISRLTGRQYKVSKAGDPGGYDQIATNRSLMTQISTLFSGANLSDAGVMQSTLQSYASLVRPAYSAQGIRNADLGRVIGNDTASLQSMFHAILAHSHRNIDLSW